MDRAYFTIPLFPITLIFVIFRQSSLNKNQLPSNVVNLKGERTLFLNPNPVTAKYRGKASVRTEDG
jgi:hypothetical protein